MADDLEDLWGNRLYNQQLSLIGTTKPGEGNGFHDRISFDIPYHLQSQNNQSYQPTHHFNTSIYLRDLSQRLNPTYNKDLGSIINDVLILNNCTENFQNTFLEYLGATSGWRRYDEILEVMGIWSHQLVYQGIVILEIVGWYDNKSANFYAFELKRLDLANCTFKKDHILFSAPVQNEEGEINNVSVEIPKSKCIVIEWPKELGGIRSYEKAIRSMLKVDEKYRSLEQENYMNPGKSLENMKARDLEFNRLISDWGAIHPPENTTDFYKQYNFFNLKGTLLHCTYALIDGLNQLISLLNAKLSEEAMLSLNDENNEIKKFESMKSKWLKGELSFKESSDYLIS
jgi:hypothetical protein